MGDVPLSEEKHGGNGGNLTTISFDKGEQLIEIQGYHSDAYVDQITLYTKKLGEGNAQYGPFGQHESKPFSISGNIYGFFGGSGVVVDRIGVYYNTQKKLIL